MTKNLSYLSYPLPPDIQRLYEAGDFARMDRVIRLRLDGWFRHYPKPS